MNLKPKVGIVTLNGYANYGNRLQNYALQHYLETLGIENKTILIDINGHLLSKKKNNLSKIKNHVKEFIKSPSNYQLEMKRKNKFMNFSKKFINETSFIVDENENNSYLSEMFDYFVVGSDQVWNPFYNKMNLSYFLDFAKKEQKISYAASFGIDELPQEYIETYRKMLSDFSFISVREEKGVEIINNLFQLNSELHVDPTLLLTKDDWIDTFQIDDMNSLPKYILTYFLSDDLELHNKEIADFANKNNLKVINLLDKRDSTYYLSDPKEFLKLINNCELFCTNSFHGVIFSILFQKPFVVYERKSTYSMHSRILTLLDKFNLRKRLYKNIEFSVKIFNVDFSNTEQILFYERNIATEYFTKALELKNR